MVLVWFAFIASNRAVRGDSHGLDDRPTVVLLVSTVEIAKSPRRRGDNNMVLSPIPDCSAGSSFPGEGIETVSSDAAPTRSIVDNDDDAVGGGGGVSWDGSDFGWTHGALVLDSITSGLAPKRNLGRPTPAVFDGLVVFGGVHFLTRLAVVGLCFVVVVVTLSSRTAALESTHEAIT